MIRINKVSYSIAGKQLLKYASTVIPAGHKVGIVGRNGVGKTTLFNLITQRAEPDDGSIEIPEKLRVGEVLQELPSNDLNLLDTVVSADIERTNLLKESETVTDPTRISEVFERLNDIDAYSAEARASSILAGLGFSHESQLLPCSQFSGGWQMRVALASILFSQPDILLLDEPTNYLDLEGNIWLENYLSKYPYTVIIISHDRTLLNKSVNSILHFHKMELNFYSGNYDSFVRTRTEKLRLDTANAKKTTAAREHLQSFVDRFRAKASKAKQAQSRLKMLEKMQPISDLSETSVSKFYFPDPAELSPPLLTMDSVSVGYNGTPVLKNLNIRIDERDRIALLGQNGEGKTTFAKLIVGKLKSISGQITKAPKLKIGYFSQHQVDELVLSETPLQHLAQVLLDVPQAKLRATLARGGIGSEQVETKVGDLSGGQKARLSLLLSTIEQPHLMILDEPTNHLDMESREELIIALTSYKGSVIIVSHDTHLINATADKLWQVGGGEIKPFENDLDTYQRLLLAERSGNQKSKKNTQISSKKKEPTTTSNKILTPLKNQVKKCEERVIKIEKQKQDIEAKLVDPNFFVNDKKKQSQPLNKEHYKVLLELEAAELEWLTATEKWEAANK